MESFKALSVHRDHNEHPRNMFTANAFKEFCELAVRKSEDLKALPARLIDPLIRKALNQEIEDPALAEAAAAIYRDYRDYTRQEVLTASVCAYLAERRMTDDEGGVRNAQLRRDIRQELSAMNGPQPNCFPKPNSAFGGRAGTARKPNHSMKNNTLVPSVELVDPSPGRAAERAGEMMRTQLRRLEFDDVEWLALLLSSFHEN
jgi:hypothetical protein